MFVAAGRLCIAMEPGSLRSRPLSEPQVGWTRTAHAVHWNGLAVAGETLFGNDGQQLFQRPAAQLDAPWVPAGPWPAGCDNLLVDGDRLLAYGRAVGPIHARPIAAAPDTPWTIIGCVHDPYAR